MSDTPWASPASLMRVTTFATADTLEELVRHGTVRELVSAVLTMTPEGQNGMMIRAAGLEDTFEYDEDDIRELAARPESTGAYGEWDTSEPHRAAEPPRSEPGVSRGGLTGTHPDPMSKPEETL